MGVWILLGWQGRSIRVVLRVGGFSMLLWLFCGLRLGSSVGLCLGIRGELWFCNSTGRCGGRRLCFLLMPSSR